MRIFAEKFPASSQPQWQPHLSHSDSLIMTHSLMLLSHISFPTLFFLHSSCHTSSLILPASHSPRHTLRLSLAASHSPAHSRCLTLPASHSPPHPPASHSPPQAPSLTIVRHSVASCCHALLGGDSADSPCNFIHRRFRVYSVSLMSIARLPVILYHVHLSASLILVPLTPALLDIVSLALVSLTNVSLNPISLTSVSVTHNSMIRVSIILFNWPLFHFPYFTYPYVSITYISPTWVWLTHI